MPVDELGTVQPHGLKLLNMQDAPENTTTVEVVEQLALLVAHRKLREDHLHHAAQYRADKLRTFRHGAQIANDLAAAEHEEQARISELIIRDIEAALYGEPQANP